MSPRLRTRRPKDLVMGLPGGDEINALGQGFVNQNNRRVAERSNQLLVQDTSTVYIVLDPKLNGPLARAIDPPTLRAEFDHDLNMGGLPSGLSNNQFKQGVRQTTTDDQRTE